MSYLHSQMCPDSVKSSFLMWFYLVKVVLRRDWKPIRKLIKTFKKVKLLTLPIILWSEAKINLKILT
jgi:hypothetical protein